jgi:hypothetical protein
METVFDQDRIFLRRFKIAVEFNYETKEFRVRDADDGDIIDGFYWGSD